MRVEVLEGHEFALEGVEDRSLGRAARARTSQGDDLEEDQAQGVDVGPLPDLFVAAVRLLGRHVGRGPDEARVLLAGDRRVDRLGDPPVEDVDLAVVADHHVLGLEVAVDEALGVGEVDRLADLGEEVQELRELSARASLAAGLDGGAGLVEDLSQGPTQDALHREPRDLVVSAQGVDRDHVRVIELGGDPDLLEEAGHVLG